MFPSLSICENSEKGKMQRKISNSTILFIVTKIKNKMLTNTHKPNYFIILSKRKPVFYIFISHANPRINSKVHP